MLTKDQFSGIADRLAIALVSYAVAKGYVPQAMSADLIQLLVIGAGLAWGWYVNRPVAIMESATAIPGTKVVTTPDLAAATPANPNIVSNAENKVVQK